MQRSEPTRTRRRPKGPLAKVWRVLLLPILFFLRKCREEYARRRRRLGRLVERSEEQTLAPDNTEWALRRWHQLMHWLTLRQGSAAGHHGLAV